MFFRISLLLVVLTIFYNFQAVQSNQETKNDFLTCLKKSFNDAVSFIVNKLLIQLKNSNVFHIILNSQKVQELQSHNWRYA